MSLSLSGKSALVTGASAGIGRATVLALVEAGATVLATGRRKAELDALVKHCGRQAVEAIAGDLNDAAFVAELAARAGDVDIMVSNAGILTYAPLMDTTFDETEEMFRTNVLASFRVTHAVARSMMDRRLWPRATPGARCVPVSSGPRWCCDSFMRASTSAPMCCLPRESQIPTMPHMMSIPRCSGA